MRTFLAMIDSATAGDGQSTVYFLVPGDINQLTGGYSYDREIIRELTQAGIHIQLLQLSPEFPSPSATAMEETRATMASLPDGALVLIDGLAFGVMNDVAERESTRLKIIALCHHPLALETGLDTSEVHRLINAETRALAAARAVIVTSAMTAKILTQDFAVPSEKITLALPGTQRVHAASCNNETPRLLTIATLTKRKGHDLLISALARLSHLPWQARFVGGLDFDPQWVMQLRKMINKYQLKERIILVGNVDDPAKEFQCADLFVLPSHFEGYGMAFAEALAFGLPIIGTTAGAIPDVVPPTAGVLVEPGNLEELTKALERLLTHPADRHRLQESARAAAKNLPTWADCAKNIADLIHHLRNL